jgi:hypothetical protein
MSRMGGEGVTFLKRKTPRRPKAVVPYSFSSLAFSGDETILLLLDVEVSVSQLRS